MKVSRRTLWSGLAAAVLAVLTLSVFAIAQNRGPEGAVSRFNEAIARGDESMLAASVVEDPSDPDVQALRVYVRRLLQLNPRIQLTSIEKRGRNANVTLVYSLPDSKNSYFVPFVVYKPGLSWRVDASATAALLRQL